ncbi:MAG: hypothetical protein WB650_20390, partial [Candidatus Binatus sp.]
TLHPDTRQGLFNLVELERFDDRLNLLHKSPLGPFSYWPRGHMPASSASPITILFGGSWFKTLVSRAQQDGSAGRVTC